MMTKEEAKSTVEAELSARKLTKKMTPTELLMYCQGAYKRLQFKTKGDRLADIRAWTERWQSMWLG